MNKLLLPTILFVSFAIPALVSAEANPIDHAARMKAGAFVATSLAAEALRPNILIIFTDDQGYADLACYGNKKNETPRMDRLAVPGHMFCRRLIDNALDCFTVQS